jgi:hypothetical protein
VRDFSDAELRLLIDGLLFSKGVYLNSKSKAKSGNSINSNIGVYQKLINTLVDITLVGKYDIAPSELVLLNECINLLNIIEKEIIVLLEPTKK